MVLNNAGDLSLSSTTASSSTTTGSLVNAGGFGNAGAAFIGGNATVFGAAGITINNVGGSGNDSILTLTQSGVSNAFIKNTATTGDIAIGDGGGTYLRITKGAGVVFVSNTTASTSTTTGSLVNAGGFGNVGAAYIGGPVSTGSRFVFTGPGAIPGASELAIGTNGVGTRILSNVPTGGEFNFTVNGTTVTAINATTGLYTTGLINSTNTTASTSTTTGALVVGSNVGLSGNSGGANWFGGERLISQMNQNAPTRLQVRNDTSGTAAQAQVSATLGDFTTYTAMGSLSAGFTTSGLFAANTGYIASNATAGLNIFTAGSTSLILGTNSTAALTIASTGAATFSNSVRSTSATGGIGYGTGAGGAVTQGTSRTTGVTLNNVCGAITLFTAAGSATWQSFTVTNSAVAATDTIIVNQRSGTDLYMMHVTAVGAGSFRISFATTGGTTSEAPVFNFSVIKAVSA
jgi:hypothetical protein